MISRAYVAFDSPGLIHRMTLLAFKKPLDFTRPTWLDMYITEPRITIAQLGVQVAEATLRATSGEFDSRWSSSALVAVSVQHPEGLIFGRVLEVLEKVCRSLALAPNVPESS